MLKRLWRYVVALFTNRADLPEAGGDEPFSQAQREMRELHARNHLEEMAKATQRYVNVLEARADLASATGDEDEARRLRREKAEYEQTLAATRASLENAQDTVEQVKHAIRDEEERIRRKTADALFARAAWRRSQMPAGPPDNVGLVAAALLLVVVTLCLLLLLWYR